MPRYEECQLDALSAYSRQGNINLCSKCNTDRYVMCTMCETTGLRDQFIIGAESDIPNPCYFCPDCHTQLYNFCFDCGKVRYTCAFNEFNGEVYCNDCFEQYSQVCNICHENFSEDHYNLNGIFCSKCLEEHFIDCSHCSRSLLKIEQYEESSGRYICNCCEMELHNWDTTFFTPPEPHYEEIESKRTFGIEIETSYCKGFSAIENNTCWACVDDYSISGKEFITPPLYGDEGLQEIRNFCKKANDLEWKSDNNCGLHLHIGISDLTPEELKRLAIAYLHTYGIWRQFISRYRADNSMCGGPKYSTTEITKIDTQDSEDWEYFAAERDRFDAINWRAYLVHGTIELRLLNGTLDAELICNWIKTHTRFIDFVIKHTVNELELLLDGSTLYQFSALTEIIGSELATYYVGVADSYDHKVRSNLETVCPF